MSSANLTLHTCYAYLYPGKTLDKLARLFLLGGWELNKGESIWTNSSAGAMLLLYLCGK